MKSRQSKTLFPSAQLELRLVKTTPALSPATSSSVFPSSTVHTPDLLDLLNETYLNENPFLSPEQSSQSSTGGSTVKSRQTNILSFLSLSPSQSEGSSNEMTPLGTVPNKETSRSSKSSRALLPLVPGKSKQRRYMYIVYSAY